MEKIKNINLSALSILQYYADLVVNDRISEKSFGRDLKSILVLPKINNPNSNDLWPVGLLSS